LLEGIDLGTLREITGAEGLLDKRLSFRCDEDLEERKHG
jgi:hypothetical protein